MDGASRRAGCAGSPRSAAVPPRTAGRSPRRCRRTALPGRWGQLRKRALSTSFISARLSQRWRSWTTMVDIAFPRDRAVTFVAHRVKSVAVRSSCINPWVGTTLVHLFERLGLVNLQDSHGVQGGDCLARSTVSFGRESGCQLKGLGRETRTVLPSGGVSWAQVHRDRYLHLENSHVPLATPPSRVVRTEEADERLLAMKGAIHELVSSSCTSGKKGTGAGRGCEPHPAPRNQSSSREGSGLGGLLTSSPMLTAAGASMAVSSGSGAAVATTPEGGSPTAPSSSEDVNPSPDAAIDILSTDGAPNEMLGAPWDRPAKSPGNRTGCSLREE